MDRASALADDEALQLLKERFVCVALNLTEVEKSRDAEGEFFRKIVNQRAEPKHTRQGFYISAPDGTLIEGWMYPRPDKGASKLKQAVKEALLAYRPPNGGEAIDAARVDRQANPSLPDGAIVVDVATKVIDAKWGPSPHERVEMIRGAVGRDRLWILKEEAQDLQRGAFPDSLLERIIRFHLVDNTRGVPSRWKREDMKEARLTVTSGSRIDGLVRLAEPDNRTFDARLLGYVETKGGALTRFDLVARGGHSAKKADVGETPIGTCTLAVAFTLAGPGEGARVPPLYTWDFGDYVNVRNLKATELRKAGK